MPDGFSHSYQLDGSISCLWLMGDSCHFYSNCERTFNASKLNSENPDLMPHYAASDMGLCYYFLENE